jgi:uncharacterized membrane protein
LDKEFTMEKKEKPNRAVLYGAYGAGTGATLGMLFGLMLFENMPLGLLAGVIVGFLVGAAYSTQAK